MTVRAGASPKSLAPAPGGSGSWWLRLLVAPPPGGSASAFEIFQTFEEL